MDGKKTSALLTTSAQTHGYPVTLVNTEGRPCPHCGPGEDFFSPEKIAALVAEIRLDPSLAAEKEVYERRLEACGECDALREGVLCSHCGCFVMFRARPAKGYCPHPMEDRWKQDWFS